MTVAELKEKSLDFFEVGDVSIGVGTASRSDDGKPRFRFEKDGAARWLFIAAEEG
jgi:hypothetical protein